MSNYQFRAVDASNDWAFGNGVQSYYVGEQAIETDVRTALLVGLGECFFDLPAGVDWLNLIGGKNPAAMAGVILQCRKVILGINGVVAVNDVSASMNGRALLVQYNINTVFSNNIIGTVQPSP